MYNVASLKRTGNQNEEKKKENEGNVECYEWEIMKKKKRKRNGWKRIKEWTCNWYKLK